jgi:RNA polymerase primary sigma factor
MASLQTALKQTGSTIFAPHHPRAMNDNSPEPSAESESGIHPGVQENFLGMYFKEMAPLPVLRPEEEFDAARSIEEMEIDLWTEILAFQPFLVHCQAVVERMLDNRLPAFRQLQRHALSSQKRAGAKTDLYRAHCERLAKRLQLLDVDRRLLGAVIGDLRQVSRQGKTIKARAKSHMTADSGGSLNGRKGFEKRLQQILSLNHAVQRARNEFVKSNLRLVVSIARRFNHGRMPLSDLIQEGNIGLIKAVERYDYRRGYRFSTYASWWIRHAISRALADKGRAVRLPVHMLDAQQKVMRAGRELSSKLGRTATSEEISSSIRLPSERVEKIQNTLLDQSLSLDRAVSEEDNRRFIELLIDPSGSVAAEKLMDRSVNEQVKEILGDLKPIEADVLRQRYGLEGAQERTLKEIGEDYKLSRERIRQIQEQALEKIRRGLQQREAI